jgi:hypothetical protein
MADSNLTQVQTDALMAMETARVVVSRGRNDDSSMGEVERTGI